MTRFFAYLIGFIIGYGIWAGIIWLLSGAFSFTYSWKYPIGVLVIMFFLYLRKGK